MTKFKTDFTAGGQKIIAVIGPDSDDGYAGVIEEDGILFGVSWDSDGQDCTNHGSDEYDLVPIEPKTLTAYAVLGKNNGLALFLDKGTAEEVADREDGQVIEMKGEYYL